jgi:hypothetical protein
MNTNKSATTILTATVIEWKITKKIISGKSILGNYGTKGLTLMEIDERMREI